MWNQLLYWLLSEKQITSNKHYSKSTPVYWFFFYKKAPCYSKPTLLLISHSETIIVLFETNFIIDFWCKKYFIIQNQLQFLFPSGLKLYEWIGSFSAQTRLGAKLGLGLNLVLRLPVIFWSNIEKYQWITSSKWGCPPVSNVPTLAQSCR